MHPSFYESDAHSERITVESIAVRLKQAHRELEQEKLRAKQRAANLYLPVNVSACGDVEG